MVFWQALILLGVGGLIGLIITNVALNRIEEISRNNTMLNIIASGFGAGKINKEKTDKEN